MNGDRLAIEPTDGLSRRGALALGGVLSTAALLAPFSLGADSKPERSTPPDHTERKIGQLAVRTFCFYGLVPHENDLKNISSTTRTAKDLKQFIEQTLEYGTIWLAETLGKEVGYDFWYDTSVRTLPERRLNKKINQSPQGYFNWAVRKAQGMTNPQNVSPGMERIPVIFVPGSVPNDSYYGQLGVKGVAFQNANFPGIVLFGANPDQPETNTYATPTLVHEVGHLINKKKGYEGLGHLKRIMLGDYQAGQRVQSVQEALRHYSGQLDKGRGGSVMGELAMSDAVIRNYNGPLPPAFAPPEVARLIHNPHIVEYSPGDLTRKVEHTLADRPYDDGDFGVTIALPDDHVLRSNFEIETLFFGSVVQPGRIVSEQSEVKVFGIKANEEIVALDTFEQSRCTTPKEGDYIVYIDEQLQCLATRNGSTLKLYPLKSLEAQEMIQAVKKEADIYNETYRGCGK